MHCWNSFPTIQTGGWLDLSYLCPFPWIEVDEATVTNAGTILFKASGGTGVKNYPVNGNIDIGYKITWRLSDSNAGDSPAFNLNGSNTNQTYTGWQTVGGTSSVLTPATGSFGNVFVGNAPTGISVGEMIIYNAKTGGQRLGNMQCGADNGGSYVDQRIVAIYNDSVTNITQIAITNGGSLHLSGTAKLFVLNPQQV